MMEGDNMGEMVTVTIRAPDAVCELVERITNDGAVLLLQAHLLLADAERDAGRYDKRCYRALLERAYLHSLVDDILHARAALAAEASGINGGMA